LQPDEQTAQSPGFLYLNFQGIQILQKKFKYLQLNYEKISFYFAETKKEISMLIMVL